MKVDKRLEKFKDVVQVEEKDKMAVHVNYNSYQ
jgi:hypothetical protein